MDQPLYENLLLRKKQRGLLIGPLLLLVLIVLVGGLIPCPFLLGAEEAATIVFAVDSPSILRNNKGIKPDPGTPLEFGDLIDTRPQDRLKIRGSTGFYLTLSGSTELLIKKETVPILILNYGAIQWIAGPDDSEVRIRTPHGEIFPAPHSLLYLFFEDDRFTLYVFQGTPQLIIEEKSISISAGKVLEIRGGEGFSEPREIRYEEAQRIESAFLMIPDLHRSQSFWTKEYFYQKVVREYNHFRLQYGPFTPPWLSVAEQLFLRSPAHPPRGAFPIPPAKLIILFQVEAKP